MNFICRGGEVISKNDGDKHYISIKNLCNLYGISIRMTQSSTRGVNYTWFELVPQYDGNYSLPDLIANQCDNHWRPLWEKQAIKHYTDMNFWQRLKFLFKGK